MPGTGFSWNRWVYREPVAMSVLDGFPSFKTLTFHSEIHTKIFAVLWGTTGIAAFCVTGITQRLHGDLHSVA